MSLQRWTVGGAVIESAVASCGADTPGTDGSSLLLVRNQRRGGVVDWTPPGGVIDPGESLIDGLTREVFEETGLRVLGWSGPIYEIEAVAPDLGWVLRVEVHRALEVIGELRVGDDPDGIVTSAAMVPEPDCEQRLCDAHPWVREPLVEWMALRWETPRTYRYVVEGTDPRDVSVVRRAG